MLNVSNGLTTSTDLFDIGDGGSGTVSQTGGTINVGGELWVGQNNGNGIYNMSGGSLTASSYIAVGRAGGTGVFNMNGGTINRIEGGNSIVVGSLGGNGTWNMNAGLVLNLGQLARRKTRSRSNSFLMAAPFRRAGWRHSAAPPARPPAIFI